MSPPVASLNHVVLISLADPADAAGAKPIVGGCWRRSRVRTLWVGTPVDTGRAAVDGDYEVGLCVGLDGTDDLQRYLEAPLISPSWRSEPRAAGFRIRCGLGSRPIDDVRRATPTTGTFGPRTRHGHPDILQA